MRKINLYFLSLLLFFACAKSESSNNEPMPAQPDYSLSDTWYTNVTNAPTNEVDVFYILPTCIFDWTDSEGITYHYGDINNEEHRAAQLYSYELAEDIFGESTNFYAPYYRQISLDVWMEGEEAVERLFPAAMEDIKDAFDNFIETKNDNRPFVIAGFSQGGKCAVELVKGLSVEERERLVAAYVIGYKVTSDDLQNSNIKGATSATDTGVTICYSSVETVEAINPVISASELCINPVSWTTTDLPAQLNDSVTVTVNPSYSVLIVDGLDSEALYIPELKDLFEQGNYHLQELTLYKDCLSENIDARINAF